jgi:hypothetical protein
VASPVEQLGNLVRPVEQARLHALDQLAVMRCGRAVAGNALLRHIQHCPSLLAVHGLGEAAHEFVHVPHKVLVQRAWPGLAGGYERRQEPRHELQQGAQHIAGVKHPMDNVRQAVCRWCRRRCIPSCVLEAEHHPGPFLGEGAAQRQLAALVDARKQALVCACQELRNCLIVGWLPDLLQGYPAQHLQKTSNALML